jgi:dihydroorotate dehydrogenase (NAD+) catalytic subunit
MNPGNNNMDLAVELAGLKLENPVLLASGTAGYGTELLSVTDISGVGGIVLKSVTVEPRAGNPWPRTWETTGGMLNSIGLENVGIDALVEDVIPRLEGIGCAVIASIVGETVLEFARLASRLDGAGAVSALEVNVSCPNVERGGIQFGADEGATYAVVKAVRDNTSLPVFVKLSAAVTDMAPMAEASKMGGASGLSVINTMPGLAVDPVSRRPRLASVTGGLSGPAIKPIALKAVWDCYRATDLPIIGGGGIYDADDVVEFIIAGATAVAVGTVTFQYPGKSLEIIDSLPAALARAGAESPRQLVGTLRV